MTLGKVPESCMHDKGFGIWGLGKREVPVGVVELMDMGRMDEKVESGL
jgi:hypothetical protein